MGYKKVFVYAAGQPDWKKAKLPLWGDEASGVVKKKVASKALPESISPKEFKELVKAGNVTIVDVRAPDEFAAGHIPGSINIFDEDFIFKPKEAAARLPKEGRVVLHCATGGRAGGAYYAILGETDYENKDNVQYLDATINIDKDGNFSIE
jgi:rhodanese-related sulfurtransferase